MPTSRKDSFTAQALQITDALLIGFAFWLSGTLRGVIRSILGMEYVDESLFEAMNWMLYIAIPFTPLILEKFGFYKRLRQKTFATAISQIGKALVLIMLFIGIISIFAKIVDARRLILGLGLIISFLILLLRFWLTRRWLQSRNNDDSNKEHVVLAGSGEEIDQLIGDFDTEVTSSWKIIGTFDLANRPEQELFDLLKDESIARVIFVTKHAEFEKVARAVEVCELQGVEAWIAASFIRTQIARPVFDSIGSKPMLVLRSTPELSWELMVKAFMDRAIALIAIIATFPFWIFAAIGIKIASPGAPVMFTQMRAGRYGKPFKMWKFRTMVANAEALLEGIKSEHGNQMDGPVFKLDRDPRVFAFGALLRKLSIDELPQMLNVIRGDMSLVGPRPLPLYEVAAFGEISHRRRLSVKPGITCEWQAGGRNQITSFEDWVAMDLNYIDNWSLWLDFRIMLKTIPAVLFAKGAK